MVKDDIIKDTERLIRGEKRFGSNNKQKKKKIKTKAKVVAIAQSYDDLIKKYKAISIPAFDIFIRRKCDFYSTLDQEGLERFGFEEGRKFEFYDVIKDSVLLIDENYKDVDTDFQAFEFKKIYGEIVNLLKYYCDLNEEYYPLIAVWIIGTYFHDCFYSYPYLFFNAMKGSGKSRLLSLIKTLAKDGEKLTSLTEAVLFRERGTLCIDEFEGVGRKGNENLRELLNTAYKKGGVVKRMRKIKSKDGENQEVERFNVYRPITMANIWGVEEVLGDRCIQLILERSAKQKITQLVENFDNSPIIMGVLELISKGNGSVGSYRVVFENINNAWNDYINPNTPNSPNTLNSTNSPNTPLFNKIKKVNLDGRDLELFFPLYLLADKCGVLKQILEISLDISKLKKEGDLYESRDIQLFDFISQLIETNDFIKVSELNNQFKTFVGSEEKDKWPNNWWLGVALRRLKLIKEKKKSGGMLVILDIEKAREKIKMFKVVEEKQKEIEVIKIK